MADDLPPAREIPSALGASLKSWWAAGQKQSAIAEERLLRRLPFYRPSSSSPPTPSGPLTAYSSLIPLSNPKHFLNTLTIQSTSPSPTAPPPAVLLHGYGAGLGFFFLNLPSLASWAQSHHTSVYALDWLGMGRSARVPFVVKAKRDDTKKRVEEAERFFVDSLEEWRIKMGLERMTLIGHSLGAYLSVAYSLKYPERVHKLVLLSPAGVTRAPGVDDMEREVMDEQSLDVSGKESSTFQRATKGRVKKLKSEQSDSQSQPQAQEPQSRTRRILYHLWEEGYSPFQLVRSTLFYSPLLIGKYTSRRFPTLHPSEDATALNDIHDYITNITLLPASGEYCISHILAPGAHARLPLVDRVAELRDTKDAKSKEGRDIDVTFVYGEHDWMDPVGGFESLEKLRRVRVTKGLGSNGHNIKGGEGGDEDDPQLKARMYIVEKAGHHVYLDNQKVVDELIRRELERE
ncbi:Alpha/Beta hydrolase protein [Crepidotus variabilis]|uniref:Alpha/Beta hydrolase protein n=1 Tax=Crepidotus variabilis TaxID=179855 RepID=A0A9P6ESC6_9AGAR|nr:Alpha/Beta hydrolase protein [Crepidotus variabilis]